MDSKFNSITEYKKFIVDTVKKTKLFNKIYVSSNIEDVSSNELNNIQDGKPSIFIIFRSGTFKKENYGRNVVLYNMLVEFLIISKNAQTSNQSFLIDKINYDLYNTIEELTYYFVNEPYPKTVRHQLLMERSSSVPFNNNRNLAIVAVNGSAVVELYKNTKK